MTEGIKILVTVDEKQEKWLDEQIEAINKDKSSWQRKANRQALIRACIRYTMLKKPEFEGRYNKEIYLVKRSWK